MKYCDACRTPYPADYNSCPKDQSTLRVLTELAVGTVLRGKYEVLGHLGAGGMGAVYKARHTVFGELRAIKFLGSHLADQEAYLARFRSEAVVARKLQHPNAVRIDDFDTAEDGRPFIVMEYVEGRSLRHLLRDEGALPVARAADIARQALDALGAAHALGIVHRDIKPDNLLLVAQPDGSDLVKVLDFGLAKIREGYEGAAGQVATRTGLVMGTPEYMSPEQAMGSKGDELDGRTDLYALGIVLYEMVTGVVPFSSDTPIKTILMHVQEEPVPPRDLRPDIPPALSSLLMKTLAKDRAGRFASADEMRRALGHPTIVAATVKPTSSGEVPTRIVRPKADSAELPTAGVGPRTRPTQPRRVPSAPAPAPVKTPTSEAAHPPDASSRSTAFIWIAVAVVVAALGAAMTRRPSGPQPSPGVAPASATPAISALPAGGAATVDDATIRSEVERLIFDSRALRDARIEVQVANGIVTLAGEAPDATAAELASSLARSVRGVQRVFSAVRVTEGPAPVQAAEPTRANPTPAAEEPPRATPPPPPPAEAEVEELLRKARRALDERDLDTARQAFEAVLRIDPGNPRAQEALRRMREGPPHRPGDPPRP